MNHGTTSSSDSTPKKKHCNITNLRDQQPTVPRASVQAELRNEEGQNKRRGGWFVDESEVIQSLNVNLNQPWSGPLAHHHKRCNY